MDAEFRVGGWQVHPDVGVIRRGEETIPLEPRVMDLLCYLARHSDKVLSKELLIQAIWLDTFVADDVLTSAVWKLRHALGDDPKNPTFIKTIPRRGYQLVAEVEFPEEESEDPDRYRLDRKLGEGGMGEVYLDFDQELDRRVALKFLKKEKEADEIGHRRLRREARAAAALDHPYICKVYETGTFDGRSFIAMEYVEGERLSERLRKGPIPLKEALKVALEIAEALEEAHRHGIVHRDIKPSNIILAEQGHVKITDFGIAKKFRKDATDEREWTLTEAGEALTGTPDYMSPEQIRGEPVDQRTDLFQFGMVLFEMVAGRHPFRRTQPAETTGSILKDEPPPLDDLAAEIPELLRHTSEKMLAKDPSERFQSVHEVLTNLKQLRQDPGKIRTVQRNREGQVPVRVWVASSMLIGVLLGALGVWTLWLQRHDRQTSTPLMRASILLPQGGATRLRTELPACRRRVPQQTLDRLRQL